MAEIGTLLARDPLPAGDIGAYLRHAFADTAAAPLPAALQALLDRLGDGEAETLGAAEFKRALAAEIPRLRAYGRSLSGNPDLADDLVQETMLKAWMARDRFVAGSSMRAWTHVILRNAYFSIVRRARFKGDWDELAADLLLAVPASQEGHIALHDLQRALRQLPAEQREALILIGASGMSCEEVAAISGCAVGTVKSRVARARAALRGLLDGGQLAQMRKDAPASAASALDQIMQQAERLAAG
ncbi:MAG: sigma-70 family RNA polymerase sigma factor [Sphingomonadales bacterium]|jgi:RNA polymerase sigma-70 factor (ECF subfamily)